MRAEPHRLTLDAYPVKREISLIYADIDAIGHVNNISIARFFEEGRSRLHQLVAETMLPARIEGNVLAHVDIDYLAEVNYPGTVQVGIGIERLGRTSIQHAAGLFCQGACVALATSIDVHCGPGRVGPAELPEDYRVALKSYLLRAEVG